ncbi:MAG TPA: carboxypeptidase-like regulatory domain-containing protein [Gemmataceae bacterium]|nr:carboxypeptidase-like regulatory domain-containing protein [Gemmataceae bacterium]
MSEYSRWAAGVIAAVVLGTVAGCSKGPQFCDVKGKVLYNGKPLPGGTVQITDEADTQMVFADLNIDGEFRISRAPAGLVRVVVRTESVKTLLDPRTAKMLQRMGVAAAAPDPKEKGNIYVPIPAKYGDRDTTDLKFELKPNQLNELTIELKAAGQDHSRHARGRSN